MQGRTERSRPPLRTVKKDSTKADKLKYKPLTGKVFYLDIPSNILSEKIAKDIKELGGVSQQLYCILVIKNIQIILKMFYEGHCKNEPIFIQAS